MPREVERLAERLRGRQVGLSKALSRLENDPCHASHYRLQGVLHPKACGLHLGRGWRLAFSFLDGGPDTVVVLYIGEKEPGQPRRIPPMWQLVHELFGEEYTPGTSDDEPCCQDGLPTVNEDEVIELMERLRSLDHRR